MEKVNSHETKGYKKYNEDWYNVAHYLKDVVSYTLMAVLEYSGLDWGNATEEQKQEVYSAVTCIPDCRITAELVEWLANESMVDVSGDGQEYQFMFCQTSDFADELIKYEQDKKSALNVGVI